MDEDQLDMTGPSQFDTFLTDLFNMETQIAELDAIAKDALEHLDSKDVDEHPKELSSFYTKMASFEKELKWGVAVKALVAEKMQNISKFREDIIAGLKSSYVTKRDYEAVRTERDTLRQNAEDYRAQLNALEETVADLSAQMKDAKDSVWAEVYEKIRHFCDTENGAMVKGEANPMLTPALTPESTQQDSERGDTSATLSDDALDLQRNLEAPGFVEFRSKTQSSGVPMQSLLERPIHANVQQSLPSLRISDRLAQALIDNEPTGGVLKSPGLSLNTTKSSLRADASREEIQEEIEFVGALLESLDEHANDTPEMMIKFIGELKDLRQRLEVMDETTIAAESSTIHDDDDKLSSTDDVDDDFGRIVRDIPTSKPTHSISKEVDGMMDRRTHYEDLVSSLESSRTLNNSNTMPSRERRRRRRRSTARRSSLQSQDAEQEQEQDMPAILSDNSSRRMEITRSTSRAPRDRSSSIEVISEQACTPSNRFGRIAPCRSLPDVKAEPDEIDRGYGDDEDDTYVPRRSRDDSQGQAKRRRTQPPSLLPASAPGGFLQMSRLAADRGERGDSRRSFSSTRDEL